MSRNPFSSFDKKTCMGAAPKSSSRRKSISKGLRDKVWIKYMKNRVQGKCYCCSIKPIHYTDFYVGHNKSVYSGGTNHINNLRPICRSCNLEMGTKSIEWWRNKYYAKPKKSKRKKQRKRKTQKRYMNNFGFQPVKLPTFRF